MNEPPDPPATEGPEPPDSEGRPDPEAARERKAAFDTVYEDYLRRAAALRRSAGMLLVWTFLLLMAATAAIYWAPDLARRDIELDTPKQIRLKLVDAKEQLTRVKNEEEATQVPQFMDIAIGAEGAIVVGSDGALWTANQSQLDWRPRSSGTSHDLNALAIDTETDQAFAVGNSGTVSVQGRSRAKWRVSDQVDDDDFRDVALHYSPLGTTVIAVGRDGSIVVSSDGGGHWEPRGIGIVPYHLNAVTFAGSTSIAIAVGDNGAIVRSEDGGENWTASDPGGEKKAHLYAVASAGTKAIVAVGEDGTIRVSPNNGQHWVDHSIEDIRDDFLAVALNASQNWGIAVGDDGLIAANRLNFQNWYRLDQPTAERLNAVVIDQHSNTTLAAGEGGTIVASSDQGSTWTFIERESPNEINALAFNGQIALFAGEYATLLRGEVPEGKDARDMQVDVISSGFEQRQKKEMLGRQREELEDLIRDLTELEEKAAKEAQDMQDDLSQYIFFQTNALRISVLVVLMFLSQHLMILMRYRWRLGEFYYARANAMKMTSHAVAWSALSAHEFDVIIRALSPDAVELGRTPRSAVEMGIDFAKSVMRRTD